MRQWLICLVLLATAFAGCTETPATPLSNSDLKLGVFLNTVRTQPSELGLEVQLVNDGPDAVRVDKLAYSSDDFPSITEITILGPNETKWTIGSPQTRRGSGPYGGADFPECKEYQEIPPNQHVATSFMLNTTGTGMELSRGNEYEVRIQYTCPCLKATWRGSLVGNTTFTAP